MTGVSPAELERLLERGWRRFGPVYFRPVCESCTECVSVRVPLEDFAPSPNLRRTAKRGAHLRLEVSVPVIDAQRLALYGRWHKGREEERGWKSDSLGADAYAMQFGFPHPSVREFSYWDGEVLVAVGIADLTPSALSAVYCYHDPDRGHLSLGTLNVLRSAGWARAQGLRHLYLGYRVEECQSLRYKGRFLPQERLMGRTAEGDDPRWTREGV